jgi:hypothetical protein
MLTVEEKDNLGKQLLEIFPTGLGNFLSTNLEKQEGNYQL